jgi:hypothetical protein
MTTYNARPGSGMRAQKAWDVLAVRYPDMRPTMLVSQLRDALGWQWSMQFKSLDDKTVFWDSISVAEIREIVSLKNKATRTAPTKGLRVVRRNPKPRG